MTDTAVVTVPAVSPRLCGGCRDGSHEHHSTSTSCFARYGGTLYDGQFVHPCECTYYGVMVTKERLCAAFEALPYRKFPYSSERTAEIVDLLITELQRTQNRF